LKETAEKWAQDPVGLEPETLNKPVVTSTTKLIRVYYIISIFVAFNGIRMFLISVTLEPVSNLRARFVCARSLHWGYIQERGKVPEYFKASAGKWVEEGVVNCSKGIPQGVGSPKGKVWAPVPMQFTNLFAPVLTAVLDGPESECIPHIY
jgi:hypothetical protein